MDKSTISMAIFNSKLFVYQRVFSWGKMLKNGDFLKMVLENVGVTKFIHLNLSVVKPIIHL